MAEIEGVQRQDDALTTDRLQRVVTLLRFSCFRLTALRLRVYGGSPAFGELLLRRALGDAGYAAQLRGGDALFLHIADRDEARPQKAFDAAVETVLIGRLSRSLAEMTRCGPRIRVLVAATHVWSDALSDVGELVDHVARIAPKADITAPVENCGIAVSNPAGARVAV